MKLCFALCLVLCLLLFPAKPATAAFCRSYEGHQICVVAIKRSAKNYWEYRVTLRIDGVLKPVSTYNCRDRIETESDGAIFSFDYTGKFVCDLFDRSN